jgi:hypothetical protein
MLPPGLEADYGVVRQLPLVEDIPDQDLSHAMSQGGIGLRSLERDRFVLDPIGLAGGQAAPVVYVARGQVAAAVVTQRTTCTTAAPRRSRTRPRCKRSARRSR